MHKKLTKCNLRRKFTQNFVVLSTSAHDSTEQAHMSAENPLTRGLYLKCLKIPPNGKVAGFQHLIDLLRGAKSNCLGFFAVRQSERCSCCLKGLLNSM